MCESTSSIMDFYKAERNRVLWLREQSSINNTNTASAEAMEFDMMNDENAADEAYVIEAKLKSACKRHAQSDSPFLSSNGKRARIL